MKPPQLETRRMQSQRKLPLAGAISASQCVQFRFQSHRINGYLSLLDKLSVAVCCWRDRVKTSRESSIRTALRGSSAMTESSDVYPRVILSVHKCQGKIRNNRGPEHRGRPLHQCAPIAPQMAR